MTAVEKPADAGDEREQALITRIRNGESSLFAALVKPYERRVYVTALALLRNEADAQDVAQEAILKAFTHLRQFRGEARFSTWLIQITVNEARMRQRKQHAELFEPIDDSPGRRRSLHSARFRRLARNSVRSPGKKRAARLC